jgi:tRNA(Ile)-lysidine synthase
MDKTFEERFFQFIEQQELFGRGDKLLLACSGGSDSMLLAKLLLELGYNFSIAHANFQLRGEESELDEKLVCDFCEKNSIPFYLHKFSKEESLQKG